MLEIAKKTIWTWSENSPFMHGAAAAYYAVFSLPGLMIIIMYITTFFLDEEMVRTQIQNVAGDFVGEDVANTIQNIIDRARIAGGGWSLIIGGLVLLFGASGLFNQLKNSFNEIWGVKGKPEKTILWTVINRVIAMGMAILIGVILLCSLYLSTALKLFSNWLATKIPELEALQTLENAFSFLVIAFLFTLMFKILPDVYIKIKYAFLGGVLCSFLIMLGEMLFTMALQFYSPQSVFGAAGSIVLLMLWINCACMILQFGAAFIKVLILKFEADVRTTRFVELAQ
tara:strand:- start:217 stop:1071 length:855 start_codon:yes stop_codon:yes gene_type:complete